MYTWKSILLTVFCFLWRYARYSQCNEVNIKNTHVIQLERSFLYFSARIRIYCCLPVGPPWECPFCVQLFLRVQCILLSRTSSEYQIPFGVEGILLMRHEILVHRKFQKENIPQCIASTSTHLMIKNKLKITDLFRYDGCFGKRLIAVH